MSNHLENVEIDDNQAVRIEAWLEANKNVRGWINGYSLGQSYIDTRANGGKGITARRAYVKLDHDVAKEVPQLAGNSADTIRQFMFDRSAKLESEGVTGPRM